MTITKIGHCCLLIETNGIRILTDPGSYTTGQNELQDIDLVLITHEHGDHVHLESLEIVLEHNPKAVVVTNNAVGKLLEPAAIPYQTVRDGERSDEFGVAIEGIGTKHGVIYQEFGQVENTGYFIADRFFYPGDALTNPGRPVEILALPVAGPWLKLSEAIDYTLELKPTHCFPVHDGMLQHLGSVHRVPEEVLGKQGIQFEVFETKQFRTS